MHTFTAQTTHCQAHNQLLSDMKSWEYMQYAVQSYMFGLSSNCFVQHLVYLTPGLSNAWFIQHLVYPTPGLS